MARILHLLSDWKWTGPSEPTLNLCLGLRERGHEVELACQPAPDPARASLPLRAAERGLTPITDLRLEPALRPFAFAADAKALRRLVAERGFDLVHAHGDHDMLLARAALGGRRRRRAKLVRSYHKAAPPDALRLRLCAACADGVVTVSQAQRERFLTRFPGPAVSQTFGATDLERFRPRPATERGRRLLGVEEGDFVVGVVARVQRRRRFDLFLDAFRLASPREPRLRGVVVGRGTHREEVVIEPARRMGLEDKMRFPGYLAGDDYLDAIAAFDVKVFLVPGSDGSCRAARELMAMGKPVVALRTPPLPELVEHEVTGLLADDTPDALAGALLRLARAPAFVEQMGRAARRKAETEFAADRELDAVEAVYREVLSS